jgi:hypothetical protein
MIEERSMPTAEECKTYAADYEHLGREADISIQRATVLMGISQSLKMLAYQLDRLSYVERDESN